MHRPNGVHEVVADRKRAAVPSPGDLPGQAASPGLVREFKQQPGQVVLGNAVEQVRGRRTGAIHAHIEGRPGPERETPFDVVELARGHPKVEQDEIRTERLDRFEPVLGVVAGLEVPDVARTQPGPRGLDGIRVPIYREKLNAFPSECLGMSPITQRSVHDAPGAGRRLEDGIEKDRSVVSRFLQV